MDRLHNDTFASSVPVNSDFGGGKLQRQKAWDVLRRKIMLRLSPKFKLSCLCDSVMVHSDPNAFFSSGVDLIPSLWSSLSKDLVYFILQKSFQKLPAKELSQYRTISKACNALILSTCQSVHSIANEHNANCVFALLHNGSLLVYDLRRRNWQEKALTFVPHPRCGNFLSDHLSVTDFCTVHSSLRFVTSDNGLLCFSTDEFGRFILCNPITGRWKDIYMPPELEVSGEVSVSHSASNHSRPCRNEELIVGLVTCSQTEDFKLLVSTGVYQFYDHGKPTPHNAMLYNSRRGSWEIVERCPFTARHVATSRRPASQCGEQLTQFYSAVTCNENVYCLVKYIHVYWDLVKYDTEDRRWSVIPLRKNKQWWHNLRLFQHKGLILLMEAISWWVYDFYELTETGPTPWIKVLQNVTDLLGQQIHNFGATVRSTCLQCMGGGDFIYFVGEDFQGQRSLLRVFVFKSGESSQNTEWIFHEKSPDGVNQSRCFVFQPSLSGLIQ